MYHIPNAHTDGDSIVFFRHSDVVATGDIFRTDSLPGHRPSEGRERSGVIDGSNLVLDLAVPAHHEEGGTFIVPATVASPTSSIVLEYRDMVTIVRDRIQAMVAKKMTLAQVKAARPTLDYDSRYGATTGAWTTDMFVEAVYRSLSAFTSVYSLRSRVMSDERTVTNWAHLVYALHAVSLLTGILALPPSWERFSSAGRPSLR